MLSLPVCLTAGCLFSFSMLGVLTEKGVFFLSHFSFLFNLIHGSFSIIAYYLFVLRNTYDDDKAYFFQNSRF